MNGVHDMGGMHGFGPVQPEPHEPWFHEPWERRVFALTLAMGATGAWNLDRSRATRERLAPATYLSSSYYEIWLRALTQLIEQTGLVSAAEIASGVAAEEAAPQPSQQAARARRLRADAVAAALARGSPTERPSSAPARFSVGDRVRSLQCSPEQHTRLPRYCRDKPGTVVRVHGVHVFPDTHARMDGESPCWLYSVRFDARSLWGTDTSADAVFVDLFEPYLTVASA